MTFLYEHSDQTLMTYDWDPLFEESIIGSLGHCHKSNHLVYCAYYKKKRFEFWLYGEDMWWIQ